MSSHIDIRDKEKCCGCGACLCACPTNCISMNRDKKDFEYPEVDVSRCIECGACVRVCPFINTYDGGYAPMECYAAINPNLQERLASSSGGIFILMAKRIIDEGGVVIGAVFNSRMEVEHTVAETMEEVYPMMGSKYVQSSTGKVFESVRKNLKEGRKVLVTGTQCQIAGLNHYLGKDYENLVTVELICHGAPSPEVWSAYLSNIADAHLRRRRRTIRVEKIRNEDSIPDCSGGRLFCRCAFRDKSYGWKKFGRDNIA